MYIIFMMPYFLISDVTETMNIQRQMALNLNGKFHVKKHYGILGVDENLSQKEGSNRY